MMDIRPVSMVVNVAELYRIRVEVGTVCAVDMSSFGIHTGTLIYTETEGTNDSKYCYCCHIGLCPVLLRS